MAFAGLVFDLISALPHLSVGGSAVDWLPAVVGLVLVGRAYLSYRLQLLARESTSGSEVCLAHVRRPDRASQILQLRARGLTEFRHV